MGCGSSISVTPVEPSAPTSPAPITRATHHQQEQAETDHRSDTQSPERPFDSASGEEFVPQFDNQSENFERSGREHSAATPQGTFLLPAAGTPEVRKKRSKSVAVLEKISQARQQQADEEQPFADVVLSASMQTGGDPLSESVKRETSPERRTTIARTRRLSSIYSEFAVTMEGILGTDGSNESGPDEDSLLKVFKLLDQQGTGRVSQQSLVEGFRRMGHQRTLQTLETYFQCADEDHDGFLNWEEFSKFFRHLTTVDIVSADDADIDSLPPPKPRARNYSTILVSMRDFKCETLPGQAGRIKCVALAQSRPLYAVAHRNDKNAHLYDFNGNEVRILTGHRDSLLGIAFSNDRKVVATVSRDRMLVVWDCTVGHTVNTIEHPGIVTAVAFSYDGKSVYTGCQDNIVRRFSGGKMHLKATLDNLPRAELGVTVALACQHHANKEVVFSRSCDRGAIVADAGSLKITTVLDGHKSMVWQAHYRADGTKLLTSCEKLIKIWSVPGYTPLFALESDRFAGEKGIAVNSKPKLWTTAAFCPPRFGPMIVAFNTDTNMLFVDSDSGKLILSHVFRSSVYAAAVSLDASLIVCGDDWGNMYKITLV